MVQRAIGRMSSEFANGLGDCSSIQSGVIQKTQKMVFDATLLNKGKVEQG